MRFTDARPQGTEASDGPAAPTPLSRRQGLGLVAAVGGRWALGGWGTVGALGAATLGGCSAAQRWTSPPPPPPAPAPAPSPARAAPAPVPAAPPAPPVGREAPAAPVRAPARVARSWSEYNVIAAQRMVEMNPGITYLSTPPDPLLAIPVLEIELNGDGSVANIRVQRVPTQAKDTVQLAMAAVRRAAPFPPVTHLPKPWRFTEVFLFDDQRRFKPRSLD